MELRQQLVDGCAMYKKFMSDLFVTIKTARHVITAEYHMPQVSIDAAGAEEDSYEMNACFVMMNHRMPAFAWRRSRNSHGRWSEPAVLATTACLLNTEINEETGFSLFDLVFGKGEFADLPDVSEVEGKLKLEQYLAVLQSH